jgi:hypothetical protein
MWFAVQGLRGGRMGAPTRCRREGFAVEMGIELPEGEAAIGGDHLVLGGHTRVQRS